MSGPLGRRVIRRVGGALTLTAVLVPVVAAGAAAHPLGNFTINHYTGIRVTPAAILVDRVIDRAEIPTFQARAVMDTDGDGTISEAETAAWRDSSCTADRDQLQLRAAGMPVELSQDGSALAFPMGQGALTTRLVCRYTADLPVALGATPVAFRVDDLADPDRIGWREIVVEGDAVTVEGSDASAESVSGRLTSYPSDLLATPADQRSADWSAVAGGPALPPFEAPELVSVSPTAIAVVPGGIGELGADVGALFQARDLTLGVMALSLLAAAGLGALHAASPGHGKTVMAAYLVGARGTSRQALGLGLTVTLSHTLGVLVLAGITLAASSIIAPERLYPVLGGVSGSIVVLIAAWLLVGQLRSHRGEHAMARSHHHHDHAHDEPHDHGHGHRDDAGHEHPHGPGHVHHHERERERGDEPVGHPEHGPEDGWHSHGGIQHTHLPPGGSALSVRGLFALGLAGGMVPSVSAIILLLGSIAMGRPAYGMVLTVAFGVGMAAVLVGVGVGLVHARGLLDRMPARPASVRLSRLAPSLTAGVMLLAGVLITTQAVLAIR